MIILHKKSGKETKMIKNIIKILFFIKFRKRNMILDQDQYKEFYHSKKISDKTKIKRYI